MTDTVIILVCEKVFWGMITAIEGNRGEKVDRRVSALGWGYIRGYVAPRYEKAVTGTGENPSTGKKSVEIVAREVLAGKWGNGEDRKKRLQDAESVSGYCDSIYKDVQYIILST